MKQYLTWDHYVEFVPGSPATSPNHYTDEHALANAQPEWSVKFRLFKHVFDYGCALISLPFIGVLALLLLIVNPFLNPGPLFFRQPRAGQFGRDFTMWKFRTMLPAETVARDPNARLETDRITPLGHVLRKTRLDELPNFFNVLRGEMSVIGPRPDASNHAEHYSEYIFGYSNRQRVKPGITGLAQVEQGYVEDADATALKAKYDNMYVLRSCGRLDLYIIWRTLAVMIWGIGAK